jgi:hypothetical protein
VFVLPVILRAGLQHDAFGLYGGEGEGVEEVAEERHYIHPSLSVAISTRLCISFVFGM